MRIEDFFAFEQTDEDEFTLVLVTDEGDFRFEMPANVAVSLFEVLEAKLGDYVATMRRERAAYDRATPEERAEVLGLATEDAEFDVLEQADMLRDRLRSK